MYLGKSLYFRMPHINLFRDGMTKDLVFFEYLYNFRLPMN
ncbi:hypothetical protein XBJ2_2390057 [Xenorhabdus bovienii str. Jollieti]|uniref:Uncharacterized protein n=1 Tax=Xenorhabdus bovienii (strain SS-2004) TaxID=406818 RepID=D3V6Z3_XENBS|nr:hypothetical protein XBJ1_4319 [Xenorhabdus bovienii SS-2004]CDH29316.1 hypothetical protein XBJ2_2390057 [Xenorhabdus bovienii str. Jollieti]